MAYPTVDKPYGFRPINRIGGNPYAGSTRLVPIASFEGTGTGLSMSNGDLVQLAYPGSCERIQNFNNDSVPHCLGVCVGVQYTNSMGQTVQAQFAPAGAIDAVAYVVDDPTALFRVAVGSALLSPPYTFEMASLGRSAVGRNTTVWLPATLGNNSTGNSIMAINDDTYTNPAYPIRIIDVVPETAIGPDSYVEMIVKINTHAYNNPVGLQAV